MFFWFDYQLVKQFQLARYATRIVTPCSMSFFGRPDEGCNVTCDFTWRDVFVETWCSSLLGELRYLSEKWMCSNRCVCWAKRHQKATFQGKKETTNAKNTSNICQYIYIFTELLSKKLFYANIVTELLSQNWIFLGVLAVWSHFERFVQSGSDRNL